jgi:hydrogenase maturation protein HypF
MAILFRLHIEIRGAVQGVGFRPFVYRLAKEAGLCGWVANTPAGVSVEAEGPAEVLDTFLAAIEQKKPPLSVIQRMEHRWLPPAWFSSFEIRTSTLGGSEAVILPDIATCPDCLNEIRDPSNRRYRYPFTNCTHCGPRYSIITALPYDRSSTTMAAFTMCPDCLREYGDPSDRRFHAQPNACPVCGPRIELWDASGRVLGEREEALAAAVEALLALETVAVKGLGGFHLMCLASSDRAVSALRKGKHRFRKPFALMFPALGPVEEQCLLAPEERKLLLSPQAPIVLLRKRLSAGAASLSDLVAPGCPLLGVMLPCTPLHHLLLGALGEPLVATSGNLSEEPICTDEREVLGRLSGMTGLFLVHDRPIKRHVDDSIVRVMDGRPVLLRRARGYAPMPIEADRTLPGILAVGAHLKNTLAISVGRNIITSQHIGDLETAQAVDAFDEVLESITGLYGTIPDTVVRDLHPDYISSRKADGMGIPVTRIQHHLAHVAACMLDNSTQAPLLGVSWDGTGLGPDGTVWGGEFFHIRRETVRRVGYLRTFSLPGGEFAVREPRRSALGILAGIFKDPADRMTEGAFAPGEAETLVRMAASGLNSPVTSSMGRLFDAVASLCGLCQIMEYEGEAAAALEYAACGGVSPDPYPATVSRDADGLLVLDWEPMVREVLRDLSSRVPTCKVSSRFHGTLVRWISAVAQEIGEERVVLTGGCFQNALLLEAASEALRASGFRPLVHGALPPNDGGIAPGQIFAAACLPSLS